jgi:oligopeptide/dipeptide ABC transporter ATP-binding protein
VGSVEHDIKAPQHPYTRLLISSIPLPDPDHPWGGQEDLERKASAARITTPKSQGCKFANRCPFVMDECRQKHPPLYRTNDDRAVACYLYKDSPTVTGGQMAEKLAS